MASTIEIPTKFLKEMADFQFPPSAQERLNQLMDKNNEGELNEPERAELSSLVELNERVTLLKSQAKLFLRQIRN